MNRPARYDIYAFIHKGLRAFMAHTLVRVGGLDPHDADEVAEVREEVVALLDICQGHLEKENRVVHAAMEARRPGSTAAIADEHVQHAHDIASLRAMADRLPNEPSATYTLYHVLSVFVAHNFEHMQQEETQHNEVLWATHSDEEIRALEHRIVASLQPAESRLAMRWMLPHLTPEERAAMLRGMRMTAPPAVFDELLGMVRPLLGGRGWRKLTLALCL